MTKEKIRDLARTRKIILEAAFFEIFAHGFQGASVDQIIAKTNLTKGAFYHQFPSKLELGYALVEDVISPMILDRWIKPLDDFKNPLEGILSQMQKLIGDIDPNLLKLGCPLNNLVQEMSPIDEEFHFRLQKALQLWVDEMDKHLVRAKKKQILKKNINTKQVAHFIVMAHEGFFGMIKGLPDPKVFPALYSSLEIYFKAIQN